MKRLIALVFATMLSVSLSAVDLESFRFNERLLNLAAPSAPELFEDAMIFTASSKARRVGIAFGHEGYARVHWFKKLMKPVDDTEAVMAMQASGATQASGAAKPSAKAKAKEPASRDSGILFYVYQFPAGATELRYRLVVDGLWTVDPWNPVRRIDPASGIAHSVVALPAAVARGDSAAEPGALRLHYETASGESVTVAGSFNAWDPFMYELVEASPGNYALTLPLPPGTYRYAFFHRGERILDPHNSRKVYAVDGKTASEAIIR
ncbi:MAG: hypothetical protein A2Z99_01620 [Treponema sp. GWB1_62_6]|nr:MAG: hypothetical protein A2Y36_05945 [Treponema sp. GWA1_62_8]OHE68949.1 MAG: hypothetical protein A2Z99_01620 [Treponema sp. GWB1_62_6]OHE69154.1 MAG: hypothetical protein A2001_13025 [Treponema sp. GWC1_61_84]HCM27043.1 isoamylase [Treponema sp.]